jgi:hypothetical protein
MLLASATRCQAMDGHNSAAEEESMIVRTMVMCVLIKKEAKH